MITGNVVPVSSRSLSRSSLQDLDPLPLEIGTVAGHHGRPEVGCNAGNQRVPQAELSPGPMTTQTRRGRPSGSIW
jgi:hypothetical protein